MNISQILMSLFLMAMCIGVGYFLFSKEGLVADAVYTMSAVMGFLCAGPYLLGYIPGLTLAGFVLLANSFVALLLSFIPVNMRASPFNGRVPPPPMEIWFALAMLDGFTSVFLTDPGREPFLTIALAILGVLYILAFGIEKAYQNLTQKAQS